MVYCRLISQSVVVAVEVVQRVLAALLHDFQELLLVDGLQDDATGRTTTQGALSPRGIVLRPTTWLAWCSSATLHAATTPTKQLDGCAAELRVTSV